MSCDVLPAEQLVAFADGELPPAELDTVRAHVDACPDCARELDLFVRSAALLSSMAPIEPHPQFVERVVRSAREAGTPGGGRLLEMRRWQVAAAAVLLLGVGIGTSLLTSPARDPGVLTATEEEAIARDLYLLTNLEVLEDAEVDELVELVNDLDVLESLELEEQEG